jgi:hypothetical protein
MLSVTGIYEAKTIYPTEALKEHRKYNVMITVVEEIDESDTEDAEIRSFGRATTSLEFWKNPKEDIYQDYLAICNIN